MSKIYYKASYENKEVRAHANGSRISIEWFIDGIKLSNPILPYEYLKEINDYCSQMLGICISPEIMQKLIYFLEKYLPYLKDDTENINLKHITLNMSADVHHTRWTTKIIRWLRSIFTER